jgi:hypothetical protein
MPQRWIIAGAPSPKITTQEDKIQNCGFYLNWQSCSMAFSLHHHEERLVKWRIRFFLAAFLRISR